MRKSLGLLPVVLLCLAPAARAVNVKLPVQDATLNLTVTVQTQLLINENGAPNGSDPSFDIYARRTRIQANGEITKYWAYYFQVDNGNFGKFGNFTGRMIVQDAFATFMPTTSKGGTVLMVDAGLTFYPAARLVITPISNQYAVEGHPDVLRGFNGTAFPANRSIGLQLRGWALDKKVGFRGGIYEGVQPIIAAGLNQSRRPAFAALVNLDLIGSEEGGFLYPAVNFAKDPIVSVGGAVSYQSQALRVTKGITDQKSANVWLYADLPQSENAEFVFFLNGFLFGNGTGSRDTGKAASLDLGYRFGWIRPYVTFEYFDSDDCDLSNATLAQCGGATGVHTADSRNTRFGLDFYINKTQNHVQAEFSLNRGQSAWGPQSINVGNAGYAPLLPAGQTPFSLGYTAQKSLLIHWSAYF